MENRRITIDDYHWLKAAQDACRHVCETLQIKQARLFSVVLGTKVVAGLSFLPLLASDSTNYLKYWPKVTEAASGGAMLDALQKFAEADAFTCCAHLGFRAALVGCVGIFAKTLAEGFSRKHSPLYRTVGNLHAIQMPREIGMDAFSGFLPDGSKPAVTFGNLLIRYKKAAARFPVLRRAIEKEHAQNEAERAANKTAGQKPEYGPA